MKRALSPLANGRSVAAGFEPAGRLICLKPGVGIWMQDVLSTCRFETCRHADEMAFVCQ